MLKKMVFTLGFLFCILSFPAMAVDVTIDSVKVEFGSAQPVVINGRTLVPLRAPMEAFGATVGWDAATQTATVLKNNVMVHCKIGENVIYRNNTPVQNDAAATMINDRTYLPIRCVLEAFGATVGWDDTSSTVVVQTADGKIISDIENGSTVQNYWRHWSSAVSLHESKNYSSAIDAFRKVAKSFLAAEDNDSSAMLFNRLGDCYAIVHNYDFARACYKREAYYWTLAGKEQETIAANRKAQLICPAATMYIHTNEKPAVYSVAGEDENGTVLGAYAELTGAGTTSYMTAFPSIVGKDHGAYLLYIHHGSMQYKSCISHVEEAKRLGKVIQFSLEPDNGLDAIVDDSYLREMAEFFADCEIPILLRFAGEMNDASNNWHKDGAEKYIEKFRLIADVMHETADNVALVWAPNFYPDDCFADYYPGDEWVDYVGLSCYKHFRPETDPLGLGVDRIRWSSVLDTIYAMYSYKKPIVIVEGGATFYDYQTGNDITPEAVNQMNDFYAYVPIKYPNLKYMFYFDNNDTNYRFRFSDNPQVLAAYQNGIRDDWYLSSRTEPYANGIYRELANSMYVSREKTTLCAYISSPVTAVGYVVYQINGVDVATSDVVPYRADVDLSQYAAPSVSVAVKAFSPDGVPICASSMWINVV